MSLIKLRYESIEEDVSNIFKKMYDKEIAVEIIDQVDLDIDNTYFEVNEMLNLYYTLEGERMYIGLQLFHKQYDFSKDEMYMFYEVVSCGGDKNLDTIFEQASK